LLSVVIPIYNEEQRLHSTLEEVGRMLSSRHGGEYEIVCSDDGSTDQSPAIVREFARRFNIRLVQSPVNQGKGSAVVRGILATSGDPVFFFDADLSTPLAEMEGFLTELKDGADVVIGTRKHPRARIERPQPLLRVWLGLRYTRLVNLMTGTRFSDYTCGFKAFRREAALAIFRRSLVRGWSFDAEILFLAERLRFSVREIPVSWSDKEGSKVRLLHAVLGSFGELLKIRANARNGHYRLEERLDRVMH